MTGWLYCLCQVHVQHSIVGLIAWIWLMIFINYDLNKLFQSCCMQIIIVHMATTCSLAEGVTSHPLEGGIIDFLYRNMLTIFLGRTYECVQCQTLFISDWWFFIAVNRCVLFHCRAPYHLTNGKSSDCTWFLYFDARLQVLIIEGMLLLITAPLTVTSAGLACSLRQPIKCIIFHVKVQYNCPT